MTKNVFIPNFLKLYNMLWAGALPFLKKSRRLAQGFSQRTTSGHLCPADIWIQGSSAGEALLAVKILSQLSSDTPLRVLVTTTTRQGLEVLSRARANGRIPSHISMQAAFCPFDMPDVITDVVTAVSPAVAVLLETELWPAMLFCLRRQHVKILVVNARLSKKSFLLYSKTRWFWQLFTPNRILATSTEDARRFRHLFPDASVSKMPNIKFDTVVTSEPDSLSVHGGHFSRLIDTGAPFTVLASIRKEEENQVMDILKYLTHHFPAQTIALFPRHMHRIDAWKEKLARSNLNWQLKSDIGLHQIFFKVILWDHFGELNRAFDIATCAFVGGSLKPLGGHNFLEPLVKGVVTVTGPHLDDFKWVPGDLFDQGILFKEAGWEDVACKMVSILKNPPDRQHVRERARQYIMRHRGGAQTACDEIKKALG